ncbi:MAG: EamA family transporter [Clostridiaceae bacterium]|nr:EamA family transporter [Clostridiaceae bacterium]
MKKDKLQFVMAMIIFGTVGLVSKFIPYSAVFVAFVRGLIGTLFLLVLHVLQKQSFPKRELRKNLVLLCLSGIALGINWITMFEAFRHTSVAVATICYYMAPVIVILVSPFLFAEKITSKKGICSVIAVLGMILASGVIETGFTGLKGVYLGLGSAVLYAIIIILNKKIKGLSGNERTIFQLGLATIAILPYGLLTGSFIHLEVEPMPVLMLLIAGIIHTGVVYVLYFGSMPNMPAQSVAILSYIDPIVAVLVSALILREGLSALATIGVVLVIGSAIVNEVELRGRRRKRSGDGHI